VNDKDLIQAIAETVERVGERKVMITLVTCEMPPSTAEKLARGGYQPNRLLRKTRAAIQRALKSLAKSA
jgi:hypothetical protein